ncbi:hypothetical protein FA95DRAFT_1602237 [Auriscalpium vulgare]|uniref:Uncharacterized protein n=1 Tax=Auriscalpium vulgare TaxID=40419 RepID=A0ACB8S775_9AGAM|nr:hypothetical protein FA95DRAFT_1602237 [Auriscalpium vulgare]
MSNPIARQSTAETASSSSSDSDYDEDEHCLELYLREVFNTRFDGFRTIAIQATYDWQTNVGLHVDGLGSVNLPLSAADAARLRALCGGSQLRSSVEPEPGFSRPSGGWRDTSPSRPSWELGPNQFRVTGGDWDQWLQSSVVPQVCEKLGAFTFKDETSVRLKKMILYEASSVSVHYERTRLSDNVPVPEGGFASMAIVLPCRFVGGSVKISSLDDSYSSAAGGDDSHVSVHAWYNGAKREVKPIKSGFRLVLLYDLIHVPSPRTQHPSFNTPMRKLHTVLRAWARSCSPQMLVYVLPRNPLYVHGGGRDAAVIGCVRAVCDTVGMQVDIGSLATTRTGTLQDPDGPQCGGNTDLEPGSTHDSYVVSLKSEPYDRGCEIDPEELLVDEEEDWLEDEYPTDSDTQGYYDVRPHVPPTHFCLPR